MYLGALYLFFSTKISPSGGFDEIFTNCGYCFTCSSGSKVRGKDLNHLNQLNRFKFSTVVTVVHFWFCSSPWPQKIQGPTQIMPPSYYKIVSMSFCNITISYLSTPDDILGEMFTLLSISRARHSRTLLTTPLQALLLADTVCNFAFS